MSAPLAMSLLILAPLIGAAIAFAIPRWGRGAVVAVLASAGAAVVQLAVLVLNGGLQVLDVGGWTVPLGIRLRADGLSAFMLLTSWVVSVAVIVYAHRYFGVSEEEHPGAVRDDGTSGDEPQGEVFWSLFLMLYAALNALFLSGDIFNLYVTLELLGFASASLVALGASREGLSAALRYLVVGLCASLFYLMGVGLIYGQYGTVDLSLLARQGDARPAALVALVLMSGGLVAKAALFPVHFWLPAAHASAAAPISALLSALVVKGAFYIVWRLWFEAFPAAFGNVGRQLLGLLGACAIVWGSYNALKQTRLKLLIAWSTVAQIGFLFLVFPLASGGERASAAWAGGFLLLVSHACAKAAMFLAAGNVAHALGHDRLEGLKSISSSMPAFLLVFGIAGLSLIGLPPTSGFAGKWLLLTAAIEQGQWWWTACIVLGSLGTAAYVLKVFSIAFTNAESDSPGVCHEVPAWMNGAALALAVTALCLGLTSAWQVRFLTSGVPDLLTRTGGAGL